MDEVAKRAAETNGCKRCGKTGLNLGIHSCYLDSTGVVVAALPAEFSQFELGRRAGIAAAVARLEQEAAKCVSSMDLPYGHELRLHAEFIERLVERPLPVLVGELKDLERACEALKRVGPEASCPFCEEQPCFSCMERARMAGELHFVVDLLGSWLVEARR